MYGASQHSSGVECVLHVCEPMEERMCAAMQHGSAVEYFWHICESMDDRMYAALQHGISQNILLQGGEDP